MQLDGNRGGRPRCKPNPVFVFYGQIRRDALEDAPTAGPGIEPTDAAPLNDGPIETEAIRAPKQLRAGEAATRGRAPRSEMPRSGEEARQRPVEASRQ